MNIMQLKYFLTICKYNSVSKASSYLFISQSALSQQLIRLEKEIDAPLFIRSGNNLYLTEIGKSFQESAKRIVFEHQNAISMIEDMKEYGEADNQKGHLSIAVTKTKSFIILTYILPTFKELYPNISIDITEVDSNCVEEQILNGSVDLGFCFGTKYEDLKYEKICDEPILLAVPPKSELANKLRGGKQDVCIDDYVNENFIVGTNGHLRDFIFEQFKKVNSEPNIVLETANPGFAHLLTAANIGCAFIGSLSALIAPKLVENPVYCMLDPPCYQSICIGYHIYKHVTRPMRYFIDCAIKTLCELQEKEKYLSFDAPFSHSGNDTLL